MMNTSSKLALVAATALAGAVLIATLASAANGPYAALDALGCDGQLVAGRLVADRLGMLAPHGDGDGVQVVCSHE
jgi:hypothetical protein